jgi:hypothetical protein
MYDEKDNSAKNNAWWKTDKSGNRLVQTFKGMKLKLHISCLLYSAGSNLERLRYGEIS